MQSNEFLRYGKLLLGLRRLAILRLSTNLDNFLRQVVENYINENKK